MRLTARLEWIEERRLLTGDAQTGYQASLLKDINADAVTFSPNDLVSVGDEIYFGASSPTASGKQDQLWKSDGTPSGTVLVHQFGPDQYNITPYIATNQPMVAANGTLYFFTIYAGTPELWKSDGSAGGTTALATDLVTFGTESDLTALGSGAVFAYSNNAEGTGVDMALWGSDGTAGGTVVLHDFGNGVSLGTPVNDNGTVYFSVTSSSGATIWKTDGTANGTVQVGTTSYSGILAGPVVSGNSIYFAATDATNGTALWQSDGTTATKIESLTQPSALFAAGNGLFYVDQGNLYVTSGTPNQSTAIGSAAQLPNPEDFAAIGQTVFFTTDASSSLTGSLWSVQSDGTGLTELSDGNIPFSQQDPFAPLYYYSDYSIANGKFFFAANDNKLWESDGTTSGTRSVQAFASLPTSLTAAGNELYFVGDDGTNGPQIWKSDGTAGGTAMVSQSNLGTGSSNPGDVVTLNGDGYFFASPGNGSGNDLWKSDGTAAGTILVAAVNGSSLTAAGSHLFFDDSSGKLWSSDGTAGGTAPLGITPGTIVEVGNTTYVVQATTLYTTEGTAASTQQIFSGSSIVSSISFDGKLYFVTSNTSTNDVQLWSSDGTAADTAVVKDLGAWPISFLGGVALEAAGNRLFVTQYVDPLAGGTPANSWISDGTAAGTVMLNSAISSAPVAVANGFVYGAVSGTTEQVWFTDGTVAGTSKLADVGTTSIPFGSSAGGFTVIGNEVGFAADTASFPKWSLWATDGTAAGTQQLATFASSGISNGPPEDSFVVLNGKLYFTADDGVHGTQLWVTSGMAAGTTAVTDINATEAAGGGLKPTDLTVVNGQLFFSGNDGTHGAEPWVSDGTTAGTWMIADVNPGSSGSGPQDFAAVGNDVLFSANDGTHGVEPWVLTPQTVQPLQLVAAQSLASLAGVPLNGATLATFTDPNGDLASGQYQATVDWGDGTTATPATVSGQDANGVFTVTGSHLYTDAGKSPYTASVFVYRSGAPGEEVSDSVNIAAPVAVNATGVGTVTVPRGTAQGLALATFTDPNGDAGLSYYTATIDWGDGGSTSQGTITGPDAGGVFTVVGSHAYSEPAGTTEQVTVDVTRTDAPAATVTDSVKLIEAPLSVANTQIEAQPDVPFNGAVATFVDPNGSQPLADYSATIDWGDGSSTTTATISGPDANGVFTISGSHTYTAGGTPTLTVIVHHNGVSPDVQVEDSVRVVSGPAAPYAASLLKDINPGAANSDLSSALVLNGMLYFVANSSSSTTDLWKTDGTSAGTTLVKAGVGVFSDSDGIVDVDGRVYNANGFYNVNGHLLIVGNGIWVSDGTTAGTTQVENISSGSVAFSPLIQTASALYFTSTSDYEHYNLWMTDGTAARTTQLATAPGEIRAAETLNGKLYFSVDVPSNGSAIGDSQLWTSDGTASGTTLVKDLGANSGGGDLQLTVSDGKLFMTFLWMYPGGSNYSSPLWVSDGTAAGTIELSSTLAASNFATLDGGTVFGAKNNGQAQLWFTDGTVAGTKEIADLGTLKDGLGTPSAPTFDGVIGGKAIFDGYENFPQNDDLWATDGTAAGTLLLAKFPSAEISDNGNSYISYAVTFNGKIYFAADDGAHGMQLWVTDGTVAGTHAVTNVNATESAGGLAPGGLAVINSLLFFGGDDGVEGSGPWLSDGTAAGTEMIQDINSGGGGFTALGNQVFFAADDSTHGVEPWILTPQAQWLQAAAAPALTATVGTSLSSAALTTFTDPNGDLPAAQYQATIDWGDGSSAAAGTVSGPDANGVFTVSGIHTYTQQATSPETIQIVLDRSGTPSVTVSDSVTVADVPLSVNGRSLTGQAGTAFSGAVATFNDPGGVQSLDDYSATVDWGDGTSASAASISGPDAHGVFTLSGSHTYTAAGTTTATITVHHSGVSPDVAVHDSVTVSGPISFNSSGGNVSVTLANGNLEILAGTSVVSSTPLADVTGVTIDGADGVANAFTLDYSGGTFVVPGGITFNGGALPATPSNSLSIVGGAFDTDTYDFSTTRDGSIQLGTNGQVVNYTNLTPLANTGTAANAVFKLPDGTVVASLDAGQTAGTVQLISGNGSFETTTLAAPSGSLTVNSGSGSDTVTATSNFYDNFSANLTVNGAANVLPLHAVAAGSLTATEGSAISPPLATFIDPNGSGAASGYSATIDWGDGSSASAGTISGPDANGRFTVLGVHTYSSATSTPDTIAVTVDRGGSPAVSVSDTVTVTQSGVTGAGASLTGTVGATLSAVAVATFTDSGAPASDFTAAIDWGDGQTSAGTVTESGTTYSVVGTHTYATLGTFAVNTTVEENGVPTVLAGSADITGTASQRYVAAVFEDVLGRAVDPAGLQYWTGQITAGMPISNVAQAIVQSAEYYQKFVIEPDYLKLLGRPADAAGIQYWVAQMQAGLTDQELEAGFIATDEFYSKAGGTDKDWIDTAYQLLLGRPADAAGESFWENDLAAGVSRSQVALGIAGSTENNTQLINDDYMHYLGRAADTAGLAFWLQAFADGETNEDVIAGFTGSAEYYKEHTS